MIKLSEEQVKAHEKLISKPLYLYGLFNFENFNNAFYYYNDAKKYACWLNHGKPWSETRKLFQIHNIKVIVSK